MLNHAFFHSVFFIFFCGFIEMFDVECWRDVDDVFRSQVVFIGEVSFDFFLHSCSRIVIERHVLSVDAEVGVGVGLQVKVDRHLEKLSSDIDEHEQVDENGETKESTNPSKIIDSIFRIKVTNSDRSYRIIDENTNRENVDVVKVGIVFLIILDDTIVVTGPEEHHWDKVGDR